jgi:hypothetical protein
MRIPTTIATGGPRVNRPTRRYAHVIDEATGERFLVEDLGFSQSRLVCRL